MIVIKLKQFFKFGSSYFIDFKQSQPSAILKSTRVYFFICLDRLFHVLISFLKLKMLEKLKKVEKISSDIFSEVITTFPCC